MKQLLLPVALVFIALTLKAQSAGHNYYFSTSGDDARTSAQAQNPATPWKSLQKLNAIFNTLSSGDSVLLKRGDVFYGQLSLSGYSTSRIVISAYGSGAKPVVSGFSQATQWTSLGANRYEAPLAAGGRAVNMVTLGGVEYAMGRYPNRGTTNDGYLTLSSHNGTSSITSAALSGGANWSGSQVVIRKTRWIIDKGLVTAQAGNTVYYNSPTGHQPVDGFGFFFQNALSTLDQDGEWYYNASTKKLALYSTSSPALRVVKAATIDTLVFMYAKDNVTFDNLSFEGSNLQTLQINNCNYTTIKNCEISYSGLNGMTLYGTTYTYFDGNVVTNTNNNAVYALTSNSTFVNSTFRRSGLLPGMGQNDNQANMGLLTAGTNNLVQYCRFDSIGYNGIYMNGNNTRILNNYITNFCVTTDDGGGIYASGEPNATGRIISGNVIMNTPGNGTGTSAPNYLMAQGIYMDDRSTGVLIEANTIANCAENGIFIHNAHEIDIRSNTVYNCSTQIGLNHDVLEPNDPIRNITIKNNILFAKSSLQHVLDCWSFNDDILQMGSFDSNYYCRPTSELTYIINTIANRNTGSDIINNFTLESWKQQTANDHQSSLTRSGYVNADSSKLEVNAGAAGVSRSLGGVFQDMRGVSYNASVSLGGYQSVMIMRTGNVAAPKLNKRPVANAGSDQQIILLANSVALSGSASTDPDGSLVSYSWTKIAGPLQFNILSPNSMNITPINLVEGVYAFRLKVVDDLGANSLDTVVVRVLAAGTKANSSTATAQASETMDGGVADVKSGVAATLSIKAMNLYPNPASQVVNIRYNTPATGAVTIALYDASGRMIRSEDGQKQIQGTFSRSINISALGRGTYYAQISMAGTEKIMQAFVKL